MSGTSTLDPDNLPDKPSERPKGHDARSLGPSDSSDSGSDIPNAPGVSGEGMDADSDRGPTGEDVGAGDERVRPDSDRDADRIVPAEEAGLGRGLDEAEEARKPKKKR